MAPLPLGQFVAYSLNITRHALESFATLPDSRRFYQELENTTLPAGIRGLFYLATCNRVELYLEKDPQLSPALLEQRLLAIAQVFAQFLEQKPEQFVGTAALSHLIAVACGLESLALGETQIAGQIKRDMGYALAAGWLSPGLQIFLRKALETQKKVRSQTGISENAYSLMSLAEAAIAARGLLPLSGRMVLVGASEMSAKVARFALRRGAEHFMVVRKDPQKPMNGELAELVATRPQQFQIVSLEHFYAMADPYKANVLVAASSATRPLFSAHELKKLFTANVLKENAALIDLALPANFSTDAAGYFGRQYIGLGELKALSEKALAERRASAQQAA
ncbi:MAG: hypothetical protein N2Z22_12100, partial [Turneriella sp.]|nr:hypothetical protein [Turneriella sp.]